MPDLETPHPRPLAEKLLELLPVSLKLNSVRERVALLGLMAREASRLMEADRASIFLLDERQGDLWPVVTLGSAEVRRLASGLGIAGAVAATGELINVPDAQADPRFYPEVDAHTGYHTQSLLAAPLRNLDGRVLGVFEVLNKAGDRFTRTDEELLTAFAAHAAIAVETAAILDELRGHRDDLLRENATLRREVRARFASPTLLGVSQQIQTVLKQIEYVRDTAVTVLITGETGTGKDLVAKAIHYGSLRAERPFVAVNCAAIPEPLLEAELFGVEKGVATGVEARKGKFVVADGGTLFLDEVGDLSLTAQAKVLRVLQDPVIEPVGSRKPIAVNVRIVAATNKDLLGECRKGTFREDLFYRLNVMHLRLPPLRERREDVPLLANWFLTQYCHEMKRGSMRFAAETLERLEEYAWPGNVRELESEMTRLVLSVHRETIDPGDLSAAIYRPDDTAPAGPTPRLLKDAVADLEKRLIREALERHRQNRLRAAKALGLSRQGLIKKIRRYGLDTPGAAGS